MTIYALLSSERFWDLLNALLRIPVSPSSPPQEEQNGQPRHAPTPPLPTPPDAAADFSTRELPSPNDEAQVMEWEVINHKPLKQ